jgi:hypothetical protein
MGRAIQLITVYASVWCGQGQLNLFYVEMTSVHLSVTLYGQLNRLSYFYEIL